MTFKQFQEKYIECYKNKQHIDAPKQLWDDQQKVYDTLLAQSEYAMNELSTNTKLTFKERIDAAALVDFCTVRCVTIINNYKEVCNMITQYNAQIDAANSKKA